MQDSRKNDAIILQEIKELKEHFIEYKVKLESIIFDTNGNLGLCSQVQENRKEINKIKISIAQWTGGAIIVSIIAGWILNKFLAG